MYILMQTINFENFKVMKGIKGLSIIGMRRKLLQHQSEKIPHRLAYLTKSNMMPSRAHGPRELQRSLQIPYNKILTTVKSLYIQEVPVILHAIYTLLNRNNNLGCTRQNMEHFSVIKPTSATYPNFY